MNKLTDMEPYDFRENFVAYKKTCEVIINNEPGYGGCAGGGRCIDEECPFNSGKWQCNIGQEITRLKHGPKELAKQYLFIISKQCYTIDGEIYG